MFPYSYEILLVVFFFKQKTAYDVGQWLEFRRVLFRSGGGGIPPFDIILQLYIFVIPRVY